LRALRAIDAKEPKITKMAEKMGAHDKTISPQRTLHTASLSKKSEYKSPFWHGEASAQRGEFYLYGNKFLFIGVFD
jgi:hypothetical protein